MHHVSSVLAIGDVSSVPALLKEEKINPGSPDVYIRDYRKFGIDEALEIQQRAMLQPVVEGRRTFVLSVSSMTSEAQNALLKTLEEPRANSRFYFVIPSPETLLPTVRSRSEIRRIDNAAPSEGPIDITNFLSAPPAKRLEMLKPLYEHDDEGRDMGGVIAFLGSLERRFARGARSVENIAGLHAIYRARKYAGDRGSLLKALLEQVALLAPKM